MPRASLCKTPGVGALHIIPRGTVRLSTARGLAFCLAWCKYLQNPAPRLLRTFDDYFVKFYAFLSCTGEYFTQFSIFCQYFLSVFLHVFMIFSASNLLGRRKFFVDSKHKLVAF